MKGTAVVPQPETVVYNQYSTERYTFGWTVGFSYVLRVQQFASKYGDELCVGCCNLNMECSLKAHVIINAWF